MKRFDKIAEITIVGGTDKDGSPESVESLSVRPGETICLLGKTGAGKSQLLDDISVLAQGDTPSHRTVLVDGSAISEEQRYELSGTLIAQLSQNMHFMTDLSARDFLVMHAQSRQVEQPERLSEKVLACANELAGETFSSTTPLTSLSGGQSRALMVADTALLSASPIALLDEIENAGIDKRRALALLAQNQKIVLISTHDPVIALTGSRRVVIENGAMSRVLETSDAEKKNLGILVEMDNRLDCVRMRLRAGERIETL